MNLLSTVSTSYSLRVDSSIGKSIPRQAAFIQIDICSKHCSTLIFSAGQERSRAEEQRRGRDEPCRQKLQVQGVHDEEG